MGEAPHGGNGSADRTHGGSASRQATRTVSPTPISPTAYAISGVPDDLVAHLLRGLLEGDGSIIDCTYDGTGKASGRRYRTLLVRFNTASLEHALWVRDTIRARYGLTGGLWCEDGMYQLTYAKRASRRLLPLLYPAPDVPCLNRKREVWRNFEREEGRPLALN